MRTWTNDKGVTINYRVDHDLNLIGEVNIRTTDHTGAGAFIDAEVLVEFYGYLQELTALPAKCPQAAEELIKRHPYMRAALRAEMTGDFQTLSLTPEEVIHLPSPQLLALAFPWFESVYEYTFWSTWAEQLEQESQESLC